MLFSATSDVASFMHGARLLVYSEVLIHRLTVLGRHSTDVVRLIARVIIIIHGQ